MGKIMITDKEFVIVAVLIIGLYAMYTMGAQAENITTAIVSGLFGIAVGRTINNTPSS
jgi:hypothetical protein